MVHRINTHNGGMAMNKETVLKAENITKIYGANKNLLYKALDGIGLHIERGNSLALWDLQEAAKRLF